MNDWKKRKNPRDHSGKGDRKPPFKAKTKESSAGGDADGKYWVYGLHSVRAALDNHARNYHQLLTTINAGKNLGDSPFKAEIVDRKAIDRLLTKDAVHQGVALQVSILNEASLEDVLEDSDVTCLIVLDQVTDPHNVGAVMRSAAAFGASAIVTTWRHSPPESGVLAKTSAGALELVPYIRGNNLADQLSKIQDAGFALIGLDASGDVTPADIMQSEAGRPERIALILGAEGKGMRQRTAEMCDHLMRLPISDKVDSLNVSNAAAVALYALNQD